MPLTSADDYIHPSDLYEVIRLKKAAAEALSTAHFNNSGYLAGYVLEGAIKLAIDLNGGFYPLRHDYPILDSTWIAMASRDPEIVSRATFLDPASTDYPRNLRREWHHLRRYKPAWCSTQADCAQLIQELPGIMRAVNDLRMRFAGMFAKP